MKLTTTRAAMNSREDRLNCDLFDGYAADVRIELNNGVSLYEIIKGTLRALRHAVCEVQTNRRGDEPEQHLVDEQIKNMMFLARRDLHL